MTTTLDAPVSSDSEPAPAVPTPAPNLDELRALETDLDRHSVRRDNWTIMMFGIAIVALLFSLMAVGFSIRAIDESKGHTQPVAAKAAPAVVPVAPAVLTSVTLSDMLVTPSATTVAPGQYDVTIANSGAIAHELLVFHTDTPAANLGVGADGKVNEEAPGFMISDGENLNPGASQTRKIDLSQPGTYLFVCNLPGHFVAGMHTTVTVK